MARWFLYLGALYTLLSGGLGLLMLIWPMTRGLATAHAHLALLGGGGLILAGLVYQLRGDQQGWTALHLILANAGLWSLAVYLGASAYLAWPGLLTLGIASGMVNIAAGLVFAVNLLSRR